jgi:hypothetical protein
LQNRQRKRRGLAGAGLRRAEHVLAGKPSRQRAGLNRCGCIKAGILQRGQNRRRQAKGFKSDFSHKINISGAAKSSFRSDMSGSTRDIGVDGVKTARKGVPALIKAFEAKAGELRSRIRR